MARKSKLEKLIFDTYTELYANCTTPADFDLLVAAADLDEHGRKIIPYERYFISEKLFDEIVKRNMSKMRLNDSDKGAFRLAMYLGCSPMTIEEKEKIDNIK